MSDVGQGVGWDGGRVGGDGKGGVRGGSGERQGKGVRGVGGEL